MLNKMLFLFYLYLFRCVKKCDVCLTDRCDDGPTHPRQCPDCNRTCQTDVCFTLHKQKVVIQSQASNSPLNAKKKSCVHYVEI